MLTIEFKECIVKNLDKLNWDNLSANPSAIHILKMYPHKINWEFLSLNENAINLLERNLEKINWNNLSKNPNAIDMLTENMDKIDWGELSRNKNASKLLLDNDKMMDWNMACENENDTIVNKLIRDFYISDLKKKNHFVKNKNERIVKNYVNKYLRTDLEYTTYPSILIYENIGYEDFLYIDEKNLIPYEGPICKNENPKIIQYLEKNQTKINYFYLSSNKNAIHILQNNMTKIIWDEFSNNKNRLIWYFLEEYLSYAPYAPFGKNRLLFPINEWNEQIRKMSLTESEPMPDR